MIWRHNNGAMRGWDRDRTAGDKLSREHGKKERHDFSEVGRWVMTEG